MEQIKKYASAALAFVLCLSLAGCNKRPKDDIPPSDNPSAEDEAQADQPSTLQTKQADIVVVGGGIAGLCAAIEAAEAGAKVVLVEKLAAVGGSTLLSDGKLLAAGTELQQKNDIQDTPESFAKLLTTVGEDAVSPEKLLMVAKASADNLSWLEQNGVKFESKLETLHPNYTIVRGHTVRGGKGEELINPLEKQAEKLDVEILTNTTALSLQQEDSRITGVLCTAANGSKLQINAGATILATGGYDRNPTLMDKYAPFAQGIRSEASEGNMGDGLLMAQEADAKIVAGGGAMTLFLDPVAGIKEPAGLYVDTTGERFMDEQDYAYTRSKVLLTRKQLVMYYITDQEGYTKSFKEGIEQGSIMEAQTIEELAPMIHLDAERLRATVDQYNKQCAAGKDADFGKRPEYLKAITQGPFYAVAFLPVTYSSFGGPLTNDRAQVLDNKGNVITGLYAAGELANGDLLYQEYPGTGTSLQIALTFGRLSGQQAAKEVLDIS